VAAKCYAIWEFPTYTQYNNGTTATGTASTTASVGPLSITNAHLVVAMTSAEGPDTWTAFDTDTTNGTWSTPSHFSTGSNATASMAIASQYKIVNATGNQTYDGTLTSTDTASVMIDLSVGSSIPSYLNFFLW
jgi:hypothetical protein